MTSKGTLTTTRSGRPRENVSPQALAAEVEQLKSEVGGLKKVLAPAFKAPPPMRGPMSRGPGDHPREPYVMAQASSRSGDIWAGDYEHSQGFMDALKNGANIAELRQHSAEDKVMRATRQPPPVIWESPKFCGMDGCRPAAQCPDCRGCSTWVRDDSAGNLPPQQTSTVFRDWTEFSDHNPAREPGYAIVRQQAAAMPPRQPETGQVRKGL